MMDGRPKLPGSGQDGDENRRGSVRMALLAPRALERQLEPGRDEAAVDDAEGGTGMGYRQGPPERAPGPFHPGSSCSAAESVGAGGYLKGMLGERSPGPRGAGPCRPLLRPSTAPCRQGALEHMAQEISRA